MTSLAQKGKSAKIGNKWNENMAHTLLEDTLEIFNLQ